jgi:hypothetical protein
MAVPLLLLGAGLLVAGILGIKARNRHKAWYRDRKEATPFGKTTET